MVKKGEQKLSSAKKEAYIFDRELARLPPQAQAEVKKKEHLYKPLIEEIEGIAKEKSMGCYLSAEIDESGPFPKPNFDKLKIHFLLDDFEKPLQAFDPKVFFGEERFHELFVEKKYHDEKGQEVIDFFLKEDEQVQFHGFSISILRENCFDSSYDDLKDLGNSLIYTDTRGFTSALKTIELHKNMILKKFEKYVVVYAGAGSWLRGEKSNDFDVFIVIDDTDVKKMPRLQVKDQLTKIIWQMSKEIAAVTGIQVHIQVYLLTDFWDALKDAHPVMFTFLRDGVPFYDRGLYSSWKELLKLGKIKPSPEAIDMHMNVGTQLIDRAKKMLSDIVMNDIYYAVLNPSQAILMLRGFNPTTPKETVRMFKELLLEKEKVITEKEFKILENTVKMFKELEHNKERRVDGKEVDRMLKDAEAYMKKIKQMFEQVTDERTKESVMTSYNEFLNQVRTLPGYLDLDEKKLLSHFEKDYITAKKLPVFVKKSFRNILKAKDSYEKGAISTTEVNRVLKDIRNVLAEIKQYRDTVLLSEINKQGLAFGYDTNGSAELLMFDKTPYLIDVTRTIVYAYDGKIFASTDKRKEDLLDSSKVSRINMTEDLLIQAKKALEAKDLYF